MVFFESRFRTKSMTTNGIDKTAPGNVYAFRKLLSKKGSITTSQPARNKIFQFRFGDETTADIDFDDTQKRQLYLLSLSIGSFFLRYTESTSPFASVSPAPVTVVSVQHRTPSLPRRPFVSVSSQTNRLRESIHSRFVN